MKNKAYHSGNKRTPYEVLLAAKQNESSKGKDVLKDINSEKQLEKVLGIIQQKEKVVIISL